MAFDLLQQGLPNKADQLEKKAKRRREQRDRYLTNNLDTPYLNLSRYLLLVFQSFSRLGLVVSVDYRLELNLTGDNIDPIPPKILELCDLQKLLDLARKMGLDSYNDPQFVRHFWGIFFKASRDSLIMVYGNLNPDSEYSSPKVIVAKPEPDKIEEELIEKVENKAKKSILRYIFIQNPNLFDDNAALRAEFSKLKRDLKMGIYWPALVEEFPYLESQCKAEPLVDNKTLIEILIKAFYKIAKYLTQEDKAYIESLKQAQEQ